MMIIYAVLVLTVITAIASLAVDLGRVQAAKTEARRAADAAARAAVAGLASNVSTAQSYAVSIAAANNVDGTALSLDSTNDIEFGTWDTNARTFTVLSGSARSGANAIRVTVRRTAARGTAVPLLLARVIGMNSCDVSASAIASTNSSNGLQLVGLNGVTVKNNLFAATYNSSVTTTPSSNNYINGAVVGSNADITAKNNEDVGRVLLGPSGTSDLDIPSSPIVLTTDIAVATATAPSAGTDVAVSGTATYAGGTYTWRNISIANNAELKFTGPATVYITGDLTFAQNGTITAASDLPANLKIYQTSAGSFGGSNANSVDITADIVAPQADFYVKNGATIYGRAIFKTIYAKNNLDFYYDEALAPMYPAGTTGGISTVK